MDYRDTISFFDFSEFDYFYHVTGEGIGDRIIEEGLLVEGSNILNASNLKDTTTIPIEEEWVESEDKLKEFLSIELSNDKIRDTSELVIIGVPKDYKGEIVDKFNKNMDEVYFRGLIYHKDIMGYYNKDLEFIPNEEFSFGTDEFYDSIDDYVNNKVIY